MNILHVATYEGGGATIACLRLHRALLAQGISSRVLLLTNRKHKEEEVFGFQENSFHRKTKFLRNRVLKELGKQFREFRLRNRDDDSEMFTFPASPFALQDSEHVAWADVIHLHWVAEFLDWRSFFREIKKKQVVWTLHDVNPFTGGCHYPQGCERFVEDCMACPQLEGAILNGLASRCLTAKEQSLAEFDALHVVCLSEWLKDLSQRSRLFRRFEHSLIPNSLDVDVFRPQEKTAARRALGLPLDKKMILFVAGVTTQKRKGLHLLLEALDLLQNTEGRVICTVGQESGYRHSEIPVYELGMIRDQERLALAYAAADVFVIPSLEDNLPNTVLESVASGTPVIGFPNGGIPDMIHPQVNGLLANDSSPQSLADTIEDFFEREHLFDSKVIREDALSRYAPRVQATGHIELYKRLVKWKK